VVGVDLSDFRLTRNGQLVLLNGVTLIGSGDTYGLDLANVTTLDGSYVLTLIASGSGIADAANDVLTADASDAFSIGDVSGPTATIGAVSPNPRSTPVGNVTITFNESVTGVDINDFTLTRNGTAVSLAGLVVNGSGLSYSLNLTSVSAASGTYVLTLIASGS